MANVKNDLFDYGLQIYQYEDSFKFSLDSILLAEFVDLKPSIKTIVDFCTGNAPVPLILSTKTKAKIYGFEIQNNIYDLAKMSVAANNLTDQIEIYNADLKEALEYTLPESIDVVTCNPPYFKVNKDAMINENEEKAIARHEIKATLEDIVITSKYVLKNKGALYFVHRPERLEELIQLLSKYNFRIKKLQFIYAGFNKEAIMILVKAVKNGLYGMKIGRPIDVLQYKSYKGIFEGDVNETNRGIG